METADPPKRRECPQKRSPFDLIMNQIRRKTSFAERRGRPSVGRLFRPSENADGKEGGAPETGGPGGQSGDKSEGGSDPADTEASSAAGWGRVKQFVQKLGRKPDSHALSLGHCDLTATDVLELATLLPFLTLLEEIDLSWNDLIGGSLKALTFHLQHVSKLRILRLCSCRLMAEDLTALGEGLSYIPLLEVVDLSWNAGVGGNLQCLTRGFQPGNRVKELHLVDCQLTAADAQSLGGALCVLPGLELLDLSANGPLTGGLGELAPQLRNLPQLRVLRLQACGLQQDALDALGKAFEFLPALQELDLSCNKKAGGGFVQVGPHLGQLTHLHSLDLHLCGLTEDDVRALAQVVPSLSDLTMLDLSSNKKIGGVVHLLFPSLPLSKLKRLPLNNCCLTDESYSSLASAMQRLTQLESLSLSWNKCVGGHLGLLLEALQPGSPLQELQLSSCGLTTDDLLHLASTSKRGALAHLRLLDLMYNDSAGGQGWARLFQEAGALRALTELDVSLRPSGRAPASPWLPALMGALPRLPALTRLSLLRWALTPRERDGLDAFGRDAKRRLHLECDAHDTTAHRRVGVAEQRDA
ncbi:hypothetical protein MATL_G00022860 [Megalops atlanticus]|uniref:Leucine rich repeat containing 31 n=1 Tax=Megalops atlanticus TaxID=7932 RepID=A0A9D3QF15_MEGAT|nr:hypothetical protein MATL_G00022860 [Megalops atlanticus]